MATVTQQASWVCAPEAKVLAIRANSALGLAIRFPAVDHGATVINISLGGGQGE